MIYRRGHRGRRGREERDEYRTMKSGSNLTSKIFWRGVDLSDRTKKVGWASRPSFLDGRDAHPTIIKIVSYLILIPY
ncbi:MAG: hypothetical protein EAZ25_23575 [Oscillatoriales cyanobacterium]|nr:MAG: hypothetical protein EAZ25_23575 [Oscillatoriales cyanobacterium]